MFFFLFSVLGTFYVIVGALRVDFVFLFLYLFFLSVMFVYFMGYVQFSVQKFPFFL